jgi:hypothetical protein
LVFLKEITKNIIDTYQTPLKFYSDSNNFLSNLKNKKSKRLKRIESLLDHEFAPYNKLTKTDLEENLNFIANSYNELIYVRIRNNKIVQSNHILSNTNTINWYEELTYNSSKLNSSISKFFQGKSYFTLLNSNSKPANNCLLKFEIAHNIEYNSVSYILEFIQMIQFTIDLFQTVPDCDILFNRKDFPFLRSDNKYAYTHLTDKLINNPPNYWPICSQSKTKANLDIPIPSSDEWSFLSKPKPKFIKNWLKKKSIGFFRGSSTGCGYTVDTNPRLRFIDFARSHPELNLDVAFSHITKKPKIYKQVLGMIDYHKFKHYIGDFIDPVQQSQYKYLFNIEGNAQAYRYPTEFKKKSVILNVESNYYMWFEPLLKNHKHYINIMSDMSNLKSELGFLQSNDEKAKQIATNGYKLSKKYINKKTIAIYMFVLMTKLNNLQT